MKRIFLICLATTLSLGVGAFDFSAKNEDEIDIFYNILDETTVEVTYETSGYGTESYCGVIKIPATVDYNNNTFSVVGIGKEAFYNEVDLSEVVLPEGLTYIDRSAFEMTEGLTNINFPSTLTTIGDDAFYAASLLEVTLPDGLFSIGEYAFFGCQIKTISVPNSVTSMGEGVFELCEELTTATLGTGLTYVPDYTFSCCGNLQDVYLPDCITAIGDGAFSACTYMPTIALPDGVETIGDYAFDCCVYLSITSLPSHIKYIGAYAFEDCFRDERGDDVALTIPESVTYIGEYAFAYCYHLTEVTLLADISTIETRAFFCCRRLVTIDIPKTVTLIKGDAFYYCQSLASLTSHNPEAPICNTGAFTYVPTSTCILYVPKGTKEAYATAPLWSNFTHIEELDEEETPNVDENRFEVGGIYYYITDPVALTCEVTYKTTSFNSYSGSVVIPETVTYNGNEYAIVGIGYSAFRASTGLTEVTIPETITYIGTYAFYDCTALKDVSLPHNITEIGEYTFYNCTAMTGSITIPSNITYIGTNAFAGGTWKELILEDGEQTLDLDGYAINNCTIGTLYLGRDLTFSGTQIKSIHSAFYCTKKVSNITFGERITYLCDDEFYCCSGFKELVIPGHITTFGDYVFESCTDLTKVTLGEGITSLGKSMFNGCTALKEVTLPESVTDISDAFSKTGLEEFTVPANITAAESAFSSCSSLKKVVLSEGFTDISQKMFQYCSALEDVTFPSTLTKISQNAFYECTSLKEVVLPEGVTSVARAFYRCTNLSKILLPQSITSVSQFGYCTSLKKIVIPKKVKSLGADFFASCSSLEEIVLLENMQTFSYTMFTNCSNLQRIYSLVATPPIKSSGVLATTNLFDGLDTDNCVLYVPVGAKETYANDENWYVFTHIEELGEPLAITYGTTVLTTDSVEITGYIAVGSVGIAEVGFEYWSEESDVKTITATVEDMKADLTDLSYATTYTYRAYAKTTTGNTIYGDNLTFTTIGGTDVDKIEEVASDTTEVGSTTVEGYYTIDGRRISSPQRGVNIIRYEDGRARKILVK